MLEAKAASLPWIGQSRGFGQEGNGYFLECAEATIWTVAGSKVAFEVHGDIRAYHVALGRGKSVVGLPLSDETPCGDDRGRFNTFQTASSTGPHKPEPTRSTA